MVVGQPEGRLEISRGARMGTPSVLHPGAGADRANPSPGHSPDPEGGRVAPYRQDLFDPLVNGGMNRA